MSRAIARTERMREEMIGIGKHLKGDVKPRSSGNFLACMKVILRRIPSNGEYNISTGHHLLPGAASNDGTGFHSL